MIPIAKPTLGEEEKKAVMAVLESGSLAQGPVVAKLEEDFAKYCKTKYAIATSNGTTALHVALLAMGIKPGDEVITAPFTFMASATSILFTGAKPVFTDVDPRTFNLDATKIEAAINKHTKAIMPVHLYGQTAEMDHINSIAKKHNLMVIEDACQSHGAEYKGARAGAIGDCGAFSFYPTKNMTTGEGGIITTNNAELAEAAKLIRAHGQKSRYEHVLIGYNFRMPDILAAIGVEQLKKLEGYNKKRIENAKALSDGLANVAGVETPYVMKSARHVYHQYTIKVGGGKRDAMKAGLERDGIGSGIYYPKLLFEYSHMKQYEAKTPNAEAVKGQVLSLPVHPYLSGADIDAIVEGVKKSAK